MIATGGYLLDTHVISETRRTRPHPGVLALLAKSDPNRLFLSVLTLGELRRRVESRRRTDPTFADGLAVWVDGIGASFAERILPVDAPVARR